MGRRDQIGNLHLIPERFFIDRNAVTKEDHFSSKLVELACDLRKSCHTLGFEDPESVFVFIDPCVDLLPAGVHERADHAVCSIEAARKGIHCGDRQNRLIQCESEPFHGRRADPKSCEGSRAGRHRNEIDR